MPVGRAWRAPWPPVDARPGPREPSERHEQSKVQIGATRARSRGKDDTVSWTVIIPVKRLNVAKSRLRGSLPGVDLDALALAMAMDTVSAALAGPVVGRVVVVTGDQQAADAARDLGAEIIADVPDAGLNPALAYAATMVRPRGGSVPGVAALAADLPALRAEDLTDALRASEAVASSHAGPVRAYVADAAGTGTVLLAASPDAGLEPCFGPASAAAHAATGAVELTGAWRTLRRDVDTAADLRDAVGLGVGPRTAALTGRRVPEPATVNDGVHAGHSGFIRPGSAPWLAAARRWLRAGLSR
jgi:2-phospho-L-lactate/phosphoenolpyruvate guanylyltransferase